MGTICVTLPNFIKIGPTVAEIWRFNGFFQNGGRPPSWICLAPFVTTHDDNLVVSIVVPNLVKIDRVVSITWNFQYFAHIITSNKFFGDWLRGVDSVGVKSCPLPLTKPVAVNMAGANAQPVIFTYLLILSGYGKPSMFNNFSDPSTNSLWHLHYRMHEPIKGRCTNFPYSCMIVIAVTIRNRCSVNSETTQFVLGIAISGWFSQSRDLKLKIL